MRIISLNSNRRDDLYKYLQTQMTECDHKIEELLMAYTAVMSTDMSRLVKSKKAICKKNAVDFDVEKYGYAIWEINPMSIPGMSAGSVLQLIGELGHNFVDKFDTPEKFCKWCNIVPNNRISGGKLISSRVPERKNPVGQVFRLCANALKLGPPTVQKCVDNCCRMMKKVYLCRNM